MTCSAQETWACSWTLSGDVSRCMCAGRTRHSGAWHRRECDLGPIHEAAQAGSHPNFRSTLVVRMSLAAHVRSTVEHTRQSTYSTVQCGLTSHEAPSWCRAPPRHVTVAAAHTLHSQSPASLQPDNVPTTWGAAWSAHRLAARPPHPVMRRDTWPPRRAHTRRRQPSGGLDCLAVRRGLAACPPLTLARAIAATAAAAGSGAPSSDASNASLPGGGGCAAGCTY